MKQIINIKDRFHGVKTNVLQLFSWSILLLKNELIKGERGFPIYQMVWGICLDFGESGFAQENVG